MSLAGFVLSNLKEILPDNPTVEDFVDYICTFDSETDLLEYVVELDSSKQGQWEEFVKQFMDHKKSGNKEKDKANLIKLTTKSNQKSKDQKKILPEKKHVTGEAFIFAMQSAPQKQNQPPNNPPRNQPRQPNGLNFKYTSKSSMNEEEDEDYEPFFVPLEKLEQEKPKRTLPTVKKNPSSYNNTGDLCLSMWQPWASLLVEGIKKVEGRSWYSNHRGRLWIAAASHKASVEEIDIVESQYKGTTDKPFPKYYPLSCLLGCVDVVDVLSNDEYRNQYPSNREDNSSDFVFICSNPRKLLIPIDVSGDHKIWKLDRNIVQRAEMSLQ